METLAEPLVDKQTTGDDNNLNVWHGAVLLTVCLVSSACGMTTLKMAQSTDSTPLLAVGYLLEGVAFDIYPWCLRFFSLQFVVVAWSAASTATAFVSGLWLFGHAFSWRALIGCGCSAFAVGLVASA